MDDEWEVWRRYSTQLQKLIITMLDSLNQHILWNIIHIFKTLLNIATYVSVMVVLRK